MKSIPAEFYRDRAEEVRVIAETFTTLECRKQMFELAEYYEREAKLRRVPKDDPGE